MSKELFIAEHERLISEYMERHPHVSAARAYDICADAAYDAMRERLADMADAEKLRRKERL